MTGFEDILDGFEDCFLVNSVEIFSKTDVTAANHRVSNNYSVSLGTFSCAFWVKSVAEQYMSQKLRANTKAVVILDPRLVAITIPDKAKFVVAGEGNFSNVDAQDVVRVGGVIMCELKEFKND
jgi:hypothetical protein